MDGIHTPVQEPKAEEEKYSKEDPEQREFVRLSDSILMYSNDPLCSSAQVYRGLLENGVFGKQKIAIKYLPHNEQNVKEAELLYGLGSHPNVVTFFCADIYRDGPFPAMYIAMELCQTLNLHDRIIQNKKDNVPFDPELALSQAKQIALGVEFIHKMGIINRDLKPQNILISIDGKNLKIADFGLSKPLRHGRSMTRQSFLGAGTDGYRAPETYNSDMISKSSDIYSLALVFYYIWSYGCHPFGDDPDDWNSNIKKNRGRDLRQLCILVKDSARHLLNKMLQMDPKSRPNAGEVLEHPLFTGGSVQESSGEDLMTEMIARMSLGHEGPSTSQPTRTPPAHVGPIHGQATDVDDRESLEAILEEENCQTLMKNSQYTQALLKLLDLVKRGRNQQSTQLMIAECNLRLGRDEAAERVIKDVRQNIMVSQWGGIHEVKALVDQCINNANYVQAIILLPCLSWLYIQGSSLISVVDGVLEAFNSIHSSIKALSNERGRSLIIAINVGLPSMLQMLEHIPAEFVGKHRGTVPQVHCLALVALSWNDIGDLNKALEYFKSAVEVHKKQIGDHAPREQLHGYLLKAVGKTYQRMGDFSKAVKCYEEAVSSEQQAVDFETEMDKMTSIQDTMESLQICRDRLKKN